jgi:hypothetical protein
MQSGSEDFAERYAQMSELELMQLAQSYDSLTDPAQSALRNEFARRKLEPPVIEEPEPAEPAYRPLTIIRRYRDLSEALVAKSLLEPAGIPAWIRDENLARMEWQYSNLLGGIRLQVEDGNADAALEVLSQPIPEAIPFNEHAEFQQPHCPRCGSIDISFLGPDRRAALASVTLLSLPLPSGGESWTCNACGAHWQEIDDAQAQQT